jgi:hypothetical protein
MLGRELSGHLRHRGANLRASHQPLGGGSRQPCGAGLTGTLRLLCLRNPLIEQLQFLRRDGLFRYFAMIAGLNVPIEERGIAAWAASMCCGTRRKST